MKADFVETKNEMDVNQLVNIKNDIFTVIDHSEREILKKGTQIWYKYNDKYLLYSLDDEYDPLVWKSPEAFIDSLVDFIEEDIARYGRS